jgi:hypothetical protein
VVVLSDKPGDTSLNIGFGHTQRNANDQIGVLIPPDRKFGQIANRKCFNGIRNRWFCKEIGTSTILAPPGLEVSVMHVTKIGKQALQWSLTTSLAGPLVAFVQPEKPPPVVIDTVFVPDPRVCAQSVLEQRVFEGEVTDPFCGHGNDQYV